MKGERCEVLREIATKEAQASGREKDEEKLVVMDQRRRGGDHLTHLKPYPLQR